jgi:hypothetical protein
MVYTFVTVTVCLRVCMGVGLVSMHTPPVSFSGKYKSGMRSELFERYK